MIIGARVQERLDATGMSQMKLAHAVKLHQSTINGMIKGDQRSSTKLHLIARALGTTTAYLSGETDDPTGEAPALPPLEEDARELVDHFSNLAAVDRRALLQIVRTMAGTKGAGNTVHAPASVFRGEEKRR